MDMFRIAVFGIAASLLAVQMKALKEEYRIYIILSAGIVFSAMMIEKLRYVTDSLRKLQDYAAVDDVYLACIMKMIGITCISEFSSGLCRDCGHEALAEQITMLARISVLSFSIPIILAIMEAIHSLL